MAYKKPPELYQMQYDVLVENLNNNTLLPASNKKVLNTAKPYVTGAINDLLLTITDVQGSVRASLNQHLSILGDFFTTPSLANDLKKIEPSILKAIVKIYQEISGDINNPTDISNIAPSVKDAILKLNNELGQQSRYAGYKDEYFITGSQPTHTFLLTHTPIDNSIRLFVNGVEYDYGYDTNTRLLHWIFTEDNGGFDLTDGFKVKIVYDYLYERNI